jgi:hypothetical protein
MNGGLRLRRVHSNAKTGDGSLLAYARQLVSDDCLDDNPDDGRGYSRRYLQVELVFGGIQVEHHGVAIRR